MTPDAAGELLAAGRAPWQVLAGAARGGSWQGAVTWTGAPYGVTYLVADLDAGWLSRPVRAFAGRAVRDVVVLAVELVQRVLGRLGALVDLAACLPLVFLSARSAALSMPCAICVAVLVDGLGGLLLELVEHPMPAP